MGKGTGQGAFTLRLPKNVLAKLAQYTSITGISRNAFILMLIQRAFNSEEFKNSIEQFSDSKKSAED